MEYREDPGCLTLSEDMMDSRDFKAEEAIEIDRTEELPRSFSLWKWIRTTNYQNWWWSCTANATSHGVQVLSVKKKGIVPTKDNILTADRKNLRENMWHNLKDKNDSWDYVEKAINTALKNWITALEWAWLRFDWYSYDERARNDISIEKMKHYLYNWCPIDWCLRGNTITWSELSAWQLKTFIPVEKRTWGHAVCLVGRDEWGFRFVNSRKTNDWKWYKSRFYVTYEDLKKCWEMFNWRYRPLYNRDKAKKDTDYLRRKGNAKVSLEALKKIYPEEDLEIQKAIEKLSKLLRKKYPELNQELPL